MSEDKYWYVLRAYTVDGILCVESDPQGSVTKDPAAACMRGILSSQKRCEESFGLTMGRSGEMSVAWELPGKIARKEAVMIARSRRPDKVLLVVSELSWKTVTLALHDETLFEFPEPFTFDD